MTAYLHDSGLAGRYAGVYKNDGNLLLLDLLSPNATTILDIGCGAGDNARVIRLKRPTAQIVGITLSSDEADLAREHLADVHVIDLDSSDLSFLGNRHFDAVVLSHVLEHLKDPVAVLRRALRYLRPGGQMLVAVPNVMEYRCRLRFLTGRFEYEDCGIMDRTHLHFFTWYTADRDLIHPIKELQIVTKVAEGAAPLWILRRSIFPTNLSRSIDALCVRLLPNLFGWQIIMSATRI
jgi:2-polyprenyl-3-methyl-5-hydroxy-6-metoxy-1,4-benzoquinol methylase